MKKVNRQRTDSSRMQVTPARWAAFHALQEFRSSEKFLEEILHFQWEKNPLSPEDRRLCHQLVYGAFRNRYRMDFWIDRMAAKGITTLPEAIVDILRLGFFQLAFLERVPPHAVVDESVRLCEAVGLGPIKGLVNAILRRFPVARESLDRAISNDPQRVSIETSHPRWLVEWALDRFGRELGEVWLVSNNSPPPIYLSPVVSRLAGDVDAPLPERRKRAMVALLKEFPPGTSVFEEEVLRISGGQSVADLPCLREGTAYVQDLGARNAVCLLDPRPGETIYDLCSAPGGKTLQIADLLGGRGKLVSVDSSPHRLRTLRENLGRCGFDWVEVEVRDLTRRWIEAEGLADAVLVDVPCSGLGTLRRKVDLRYRLKPEDIPELAKKGESLLRTAAGLVQTGGRLVFSTCTLTREENEETVQRFLEAGGHEWEWVSERKSPDWLDTGSGREGQDSDGSYCALLRKK